MSEENFHRTIFKFGSFSLNAEARRLSHNGQYVPLAVKTFDILLLLLRQRGRLVTKEELMSAVWPDQFVEENNLTVRICALRRALGEKPHEHKYIETAPGHGYRFVAAVKEGEDDGAEQGGPEPVGTARQEAAGGRPESPMYLAVLPFANENADPNTEYLSEGITESVIDSLSFLPRIKVMARAAVCRYTGRQIDPCHVGRELGVKAVLVGRVLLTGDTLVVSAELMNVADRSHVWGSCYRYQLPDLFILQKEIASEVSESLLVRLTGEGEERRAKRHPQNPDTYLLHLKGRYFWNKRSIKGLTNAVEYFQRAIELDPSYAPAHAGLADCYITLTDNGVLPPSETLPKARAAIVRALELDNRLAEAHAAQAKVMSRYGWDFVGAEREYGRAIGLNPSYATAYLWHADHLARVGRFTDALLEIKNAQRIDPLSLTINRLIAKILYFARQYEEAIEQCLETLEIDPDFALGYWPLGQCYVEVGMYEEAITTLRKCASFADYHFLASWNKESKPQRVSRSEPDPETIATLAYAYAKANERKRAANILNGLIELSERRYTEPHAIAMIYTGLGDNDRAFKWLEKAYAVRSSTLTYIGVWPVFDGLRSDPRFTALLKRIGLAAR